MGGGNCTFFGCPTCGKHKISLFRVPSVAASDGEHTKEMKLKARKEWLRLVLWTRELTPELKKRIEANNIFICERHFRPECILTGKRFTCNAVVYCVIKHEQFTYTAKHHEYFIFVIYWTMSKQNLISISPGKRKTLVTGSVPTENLPEKSHEAPKRERRPLVRKVDTPDIGEPSTSSQPGWSEPRFLNMEDFTMQLEQETIHPWKINKSYEGELRIELDDKIHSIPKYSVVVSLSMEFTVFIFNWPVPDHHPIYKERKCSVQNSDIAELLQTLCNSRLCEGLTEDEDILSIACDPTGNPDSNPNTIVRHSVPKTI